MLRLIILTLFLTAYFGAFGQTKFEFQIKVEDRVRSFIVSVPTKLPPAEGYPVVFVLHGTSGDMNTFYDQKGWKELGQEKNFITIFPSALVWCFTEDGVMKRLSRFTCGGLVDNICPEDEPKLIDDILFFRTIYQKLSDTVSVNPEKVFASGFSNGSCMAHKLMAYGSDLFSAVAGSSAFLHEIDSLIPERRIPAWGMLGTRDDRYLTDMYPDELPFEGDTILARMYNPISRALNCQGLTEHFEKITTEISHHYIFNECKKGENCAPYIFTINKDQRHIFPNGVNYPLDAPRLFWEFFNNPPEVTTGISETNFTDNYQLKMLPNPVSNVLNISPPNNFVGLKKIFIYDMVGNIIFASNSEEDSISINISDLSSGIYSVRVLSNKRSLSNIFIKI